MTLAGLTVLVLAFWGCMFIYFARTDPDSLRSERFTIEKMAIQRGMVGDNLSGMRRVANETEDAPALPAQGSAKERE